MGECLVDDTFGDIEAKLHVDTAHSYYYMIFRNTLEHQYDKLSHFVSHSILMELL